jgi:hypothetical protein
VGPELYQRHYPIIGAPIDQSVEDFFAKKSQDVENMFDAMDVKSNVWDIMEECEEVTGRSVSWPIAADRLHKNLGREKYNQIFPHPNQEIDQNERQETEKWWLNQADLLSSGKIEEIESQTSYKKRIHRDYATVSKYGAITLQNKYGVEEGNQIYSDLRRIDIKITAVGRENHPILNYYFQDGFNEIIQEYPNPRPEIFRESHNSEGKRCDLIIADVYRNNYLKNCLAQRPLPVGKTIGEILGIPPETARRYTDLVLDHTKLKGLLAIQEKAKYCDGKTLTIVAYTGEENPNWDVISSPKYPDIIEVPATTAAKLLQLPEDTVWKIENVVKLSEQWDIAQLKNLKEIEKSRHPGDLEWDTTKYKNYQLERDENQRNKAEQRAKEYRRKERISNNIERLYENYQMDIKLDHYLPKTQKMENSSNIKSERDPTSKTR